MQKKGVGNCLYVVVEPSKKGGGKSFYGEFRFPPGGGGKLIRVCIGPYGTAPGQWTLKAAKDEWTRIRAWSLEAGRDPRVLNGRGRKQNQAQGPSKTLDEAIKGFIEELIRSGGVCERDKMMNLYQTNPDLERYSDWSASWNPRRFKDIAAGK